jgi:hypothetical protein
MLVARRNLEPYPSFQAPRHTRRYADEDRSQLHGDIERFRRRPLGFELSRCPSGGWSHPHSTRLSLTALPGFLDHGEVRTRSFCVRARDITVRRRLSSGSTNAICLGRRNANAPHSENALSWLHRGALVSFSRRAAKGVAGEGSKLTSGPCKVSSEANEPAVLE